MRILHVIHSVDPRSGGPSHSLRGLVKAQASQGHQVTIVATLAQSAEPWAPRHEFMARMKVDPSFAGAELILGPAWGRRRPWSRFSYCPRTVQLLRAALADKHTRPDVIHVHGAFSHLTIAAFRLARRFGIPYIFRPAGSFDDTCLRKGMATWKRVFLALFHKQDLRRAAAVHVTSEAEGRQVDHLVPGCRLWVIPHGVDLPSAAGVESQARLLARWPQLAGRRVLLFLSRLHEKKRPTWLLQSLIALLPDIPDLALLFAGPDAGMAEMLSQQARAAGLDGQVVFAGFLQGEDKAAAFSLAAVFCLPSQDENFGVAVVEAMAYSVPVVVTPGVATSEHVRRSRCGIVAEDFVESVTEAIRQVLRMDRWELGQRGREYVERHLTWPIIAQQVEKMYCNALGL